MSYGWVSIHRQIQEHWLWEDKPFSYGHAWVDLILMANHTDNRFPLGNEIVTVQVGSFITSELKLADRWGWSKTKVRRFLSLLENDSMIVKKTDRKKTTINIVNYSVFQVSETAEKPIKDHKKTDKKPIKNTNNNDNNDNNENKNILYAESPVLNEVIINFIKHRKTMKKPMSEQAIKLLISKLNKLSSDENTQIEILNQSIVNGWQGIFPLKNQNNQNNSTGRKEIVPDWMNNKKKNNFTGFENQRDYDIDKLEADLLRKSRNTPTNNPELAERVEALKARIGKE